MNDAFSVSSPMTTKAEITVEAKALVLVEPSAEPSVEASNEMNAFINASGSISDCMRGSV